MFLPGRGRREYWRTVWRTDMKVTLARVRWQQWRNIEEGRFAICVAEKTSSQTS